MRQRLFLTGPGKALLYARIALHVAARYAAGAHSRGWSVADYGQFLYRALRLLLVFRHNKAVRVGNGHKLHLYVPAYPSPAFFHTLESKLIARPPGPTTVVFSITKACRYRCKHCYQRNDGGQDVDEALMLRTAGLMQDAGVALFDVEGGEPLLRFPRLMKLVDALDERSEIWVNTTGDGLTDDKLKALKAAGVFGAMVSVHSTDPAIHDAFTGVPGSLDKALEALRAFRAQGLATAINSVLSENEVVEGRLDDLMRLARDVGCHYVQLIHPKPAGTWMNRREQMQSDEKIIRKLQREHVRYNSRRTREYPSLAAQVFEESPRVLGCTAGGVDRFYLNAHGEVQPCEFLNLSFGNVNDEPFQDILARMRAHFPTPCTDWLCCTQADAIADLIHRHGITRTPVPWKHTRELVERWRRGDATPVYERLGIYT
jgi:MoaA/NifB/PqqE/SkfB family radical SAM enzyme